MNKKFDITDYISNVQGQLSAANGNNYSNFAGDYSFLEAQGGQGAMVALPAPVAPNAKSPSPYQLIISNSTAGSLTCVLFGQNQYLLEPNYGSATGITVTPAATNVSYTQLLQQSAFQPFETSLIRIQCGLNPTQITQLINLNVTDANGQTAGIPIYTQDYFSAYQQQPGILDMPYNMKIDGNTSLSFIVLASTTVFMTFFPAVKVNPARLVGGQGADVIYSNPQVNLGGMTFPKPAIMASRLRTMLR